MSLVDPLVTTYGSMENFIYREIKHPHKLERSGENMTKTSGKTLDNQIGQRSKFRRDFWEDLQDKLHDMGKSRMPAGAQHLLANALINWTLNYIEQR